MPSADFDGPIQMIEQWRRLRLVAAHHSGPVLAALRDLQEQMARLERAVLRDSVPHAALPPGVTSLTPIIAKRRVARERAQLGRGAGGGDGAA